MRLRCSWCAMAASALFIFSAPRVRAGDLPVPAGKAPTAKDCVDGVAAASNAGDADRLASFLIEPYRSSFPRMMKAGARMDGAVRRLSAACERRFGDGTAAKLHLDPLPSAKVQFGTIEVVSLSEGGGVSATASLSVTKAKGEKPRRKEVSLVKEGGFWFAGIPHEEHAEPDPEMEGRLAEALSVALLAGEREVDAITADVEGETPPAKEEVTMRYRNAQMNVQRAVIMTAGLGNGQPPAPSAHPRRKPSVDAPGPSTATARPKPRERPAEGSR